MNGAVAQQEVRCTSEHAESETRTHGCKLVKSHEGDHRCICGRTWS